MVDYPTRFGRQRNNDMEKFLLFVDAADDAGCWPASKLAAMTCASDGVVLLRFASGIAGGTGAGALEADLVTLTITADKERAVMIAIGEAIGGLSTSVEGHNTSNVIEVCNDVTSAFLHANILSCTITLDS